MLKRNFIFLFISNFFFFLTSGMFHLFQVYLGSLGASKSYIGLAMGITFFTQIVVIFLLRNYVDKINKRNSLLYASLCGILLFPLYYLTTDFTVFIILRSLQGIIIAFGFPIAMALAVDIIPSKKRISLVGIFGLSGAMTNLFGPVIAEIITKSYSYKYVFLCCSFASFLWFIMLLFISPNIKNPHRNLENKSSIKDYNKIIPMAIIFGMVFSSFFSFISHYAKELKIVPVSVFFQAYTITMILIRVSLQNQLNKWGFKKIILTGFIISVVALWNGFFIYYNSTIIFLIILGILYGSSHSLLYPSLNSLFVELTPHRSGKATLIFIVFFSLGMAIASTFYGVMADFIGYNLMYAFSAVFTLISLPFLFKNNKVFEFIKRI
jgi:MFS family permease